MVDPVTKGSDLGVALNMRITPEIDARLEALGAAIEARTGVEAARSSVARAAMLRGLPELERDNGIAPPKAKAKRAARGKK